MTAGNLEDSVILNVDDYVPGRYARTKLLRQRGFPVVEAGTGQEALDMVSQHKPTVVLLDVNLPDMNGFEVCKRLRSNPDTASTTILHISASSILSQHQVNGLDGGADGYIVEPVEPEVLIATINAFIRARRAEETSRRANEALRWFAYRVGHDLNEPLRTVSIYSQLLKSRLATDLDDETNGYLNFIGDATVKMRGLMDGLLHYAEATATESAPREIDCETMLKGILAELGAMVNDSHACISHDPLPVVHATPQIEHVFQNLITNAVKYARNGVPPEIHISAVQEKVAWVLSVRDNGRGIAPEYQDRVFEIFKRLGNDVPGNGIGLALARQIVEANGGTIRVTSEPGVGSTFYFTLPRESERAK